MTEGAEPSGPTGPSTVRAGILAQFERMIVAIRDGDDALVESTIVAISQRSRFLTPLTFVVGAFVMLFQGVKLLVTNWRLTLVQIIPAMLIWLAMLDLKVHMLRGRQLHVIRGPVLIPVILGLAILTAGAYYLNAVFAFSVAEPGKPEIRPAFIQASRHRVTILGWGFVIGLALGFATSVTARWGKGWFGLSLGIVVAVMMVTYVAVPSRLIGIKSDRSRRDKLTATAIGGALGAVVCSPPYLMGRVGIVLLGSHTFLPVGVALLVVAIPLQTGAVTATKAVKFSAKLVTTQVAEVAGVGAATIESANGGGPRRFTVVTVDHSGSPGGPSGSVPRSTDPAGDAPVPAPPASPPARGATLAATSSAVTGSVRPGPGTEKG